MYFKTNRYEYRSQSSDVWYRRQLGTGKWKYLSARFWRKIKRLRKMSFQLMNQRSTLADTVRIRLNKRYNEQTKKTTKWAYKHGVPLNNLITR